MLFYRVKGLTVTPLSSIELARKIRRDALIQIHRAGSGHPGGSLSAADIIAVLFSDILKLKPEKGARHSGNRFILSKGHACPAMYAAWVHTGLMPAEELLGFRKIGHALQGLPHPTTTPLCEVSTGSLGQGFSTAVGIALGYRHQKKPGHVYAVLGDGELQAGIVWEAAMCAAHYKLGNLTGIIDYNKLQSDRSNNDIIRLEPLADKWRAFGWTVIEADGHDHAALHQALSKSGETPSMLIAHTVKGKGVSWMENIPAWHGSVKLSDKELDLALEELQ